LKPDARSSTILFDELNSGLFQSLLHRVDGRTRDRQFIPTVYQDLFAFALFRSNRTLWPPKPNARSSTMLRDELDAGHLQRALNRFEVVRHRNRSPCLEISNCTFPDLRFGRQVGL